MHDAPARERGPLVPARAQAIVDTATAGTMAAVAASPAAVAGGGVAVPGAVTSGADRPAAILRGGAAGRWAGAATAACAADVRPAGRKAAVVVSGLVAR
jgi:hypothetical protein